MASVSQFDIISQSKYCLFLPAHTHSMLLSVITGYCVRYLSSKHLVFPQPAEALCALSHGKCPVGGATSASVWWLQKVWKLSGPPPEGGAHLGHVFRGQVRYNTVQYLWGEWFVSLCSMLLSFFVFVTLLHPLVARAIHTRVFSPPRLVPLTGRG